jgi:TolB-like protein
MSFFEELKRRNVVKVGIAYVVASWLLLQLTEVLTELLEIGPEVGKIVIALILVGFIPVLIFAWAFEMTPEGIKREHEVDRSSSVTHQTGRKLDFAVIGMLVLIAGYFIWEARFKDNAEMGSEPFSSATAETTGEDAPEKRALTPSNSIAVLPFANRSNVEDDLFFTDGIHDDLLTQLAKIDDLKVISRTSVMEYRDTTRKIPEIAEELGVSKILEGGVQRAGKRIRINAQLIDVASDEHLWAETFDREMTVDNIFEIQSEITRQIVQAVRGELTEEEQQAIGERPTNNLEAWEAYLHTLAILRRPEYSAQKYQQAEPWAQRAVDLDPDFAEAWAVLSEIQSQGVWIGYANTPEQRDRVRTSLARAVALAPDSGLVIAAQAEYQYRIEVDYFAAHALYEKALEIAPGDAEIRHYKAVTERRLGLWEQAIDTFGQTLELDPLNGFAAMTMIETLTIMNEWERAEHLADQWLLRNPESGALTALKVASMVNSRGDLEGARRTLDQAPESAENFLPGVALNLASNERDWERLIDVANDDELFESRLKIFNWPDLRKGKAYFVAGEMEAARQHLEKHIRETTDLDLTGRIANAFRLQSLADAHAFLGNNDSALAYIAEAKALMPAEQDHLFGSNIERTNIRIQAMTGNRDKALELIAARLDQPEGFSRWRLQLDPEWDFFRDDERFNNLVRPDGLEEEAARPRQRLGDGT